MWNSISKLQGVGLSALNSAVSAGAGLLERIDDNLGTDDEAGDYYDDDGNLLPGAEEDPPVETAADTDAPQGLEGRIIVPAVYMTLTCCIYQESRSFIMRSIMCSK